MRAAGNGAAAVNEHPQRQILAGELHARPPVNAAAPLRVFHYALLTAEAERERDREHLLALCGCLGLAPPPARASHFHAMHGTLQIKWERHTEFTTWTFFEAGSCAGPFAGTEPAALPPHWWQDTPGDLLVAVRLAVLEPGAKLDAADLERYFDPAGVVGSHAAGGRARVWTDLRLHADGQTRFLIEDCGLNTAQAGRLLQRLFELETYRMLALLGLPLAQATAPRIRAIELRLQGLTEQLGAAAGLAEQKALLHELTRLWAEVEDCVANTAYRFSATQAYYAITRARAAAFDEAAGDTVQSLSDFIGRRLEPAVRTCEAVAAREERLSQRLNRAADLLRTRVDVAVEQQSADLLASMNRRARLQLRLQETVEGLSVAAITYYLVGLVGYGAHALRASGVVLDVALTQGLAIPVVALAVWAGVRRVRRHLRG